MSADLEEEEEEEGDNREEEPIYELADLDVAAATPTAAEGGDGGQDLIAAFARVRSFFFFRKFLGVKLSFKTT